MRRHLWIIPLAALVALAPLLRYGESCGQDLPFHLTSWFDAALQLRHGTLYPRWAFDAAWNFGEPRFTFYPPLTWLLGAALTLVFPPFLLPTVFKGIIFTLAGLSMFRLATRWCSPTGALLAACVYLANPYMVFTAATRNAFGELAAAALCPLLVEAVLAAEPSPWAVGTSLALLWLCNVPGAILGTYLFALLAAGSLISLLLRPAPASAGSRLSSFLSRSLTFVAAVAITLGLAAVYLLPALSQRSLVRMNDAFPVGLRPTDNLLLHRILLPGRDAFLITIQHITALMALVTVVALVIAWLSAQHAFTGSIQLAQRTSTRTVLVTTLLVTCGVLFMMSFLSAPLWRTLPALWVVGLPWRSLFVLAICLSLATGLALRGLHLSTPLALLAVVLLVAALSFSANARFQQGCDATETPSAQFAALRSHNPPDPTAEYVPIGADPELLQPDNPPFFTTLDINALPPTVTHTSATPLHLTLDLAKPQFLVLNLESWPNWQITRDGQPITPLHRQDGLIALPVPAGSSTIDITWHHSAAEILGTLITLVTALLGLAHRRRRQKPLPTVLATAILALIAVPSLHAQQTPATDTPYVIHVYENLIQLPTLVLDGKHQLPPPIARDRFELSMDAGPKFHPTHMHIEGDEPISLAILIDATHDGPKFLPFLPEDLAALAPAALHPTDHISVFGYDCTLLRSALNVPADPTTLRSAVDRLFDSPKLHGTDPRHHCKPAALLDAVAAAAESLGTLPGRRVLLILSNGHTRSSRVKFSELVGFTVSRSVAIFGISDPLIVFSPSSPLTLQSGPRSFRTTLPGSDASGENLFDILCQRNGGLLSSTQPKLLPAELLRFVSLVRGRYILEFPRPNQNIPGDHLIDALVDGMADAYVRPAGLSIPPPPTPDANSIPEQESPATFGKHRPLQRPD